MNLWFDKSYYFYVLNAKINHCRIKFVCNYHLAVVNFVLATIIRIFAGMCRDRKSLLHLRDSEMIQNWTRTNKKEYLFVHKRCVFILQTNDWTYALYIGKWACGRKWAKHWIFHRTHTYRKWAKLKQKDFMRFQMHETETHQKWNKRKDKQSTSKLVDLIFYWYRCWYWKPFWVIFIWKISHFFLFLRIFHRFFLNYNDKLSY